MRAILIATGLALGVGFGAAAEMANSEKVSAATLEKATTQGLVRVIVTVDFASEGAQSAGSSCVNDDCAKLEISNAMLPSEAPTVEILPGNMILMEATPSGLETLQRLPQVVSIVEDGAVPSNEMSPGIDAPTGH